MLLGALFVLPAWLSGFLATLQLYGFPESFLSFFLTLHLHLSQIILGIVGVKLIFVFFNMTTQLLPISIISSRDSQYHGGTLQHVETQVI